MLWSEPSQTTDLLINEIFYEHIDRSGNRRHDRNDHVPTVQCSGWSLFCELVASHGWRQHVWPRSREWRRGSEIVDVRGQSWRCEYTGPLRFIVSQDGVTLDISQGWQQVF